MQIFLIPGATAKVLSSGINDIKEIAILQKNLRLAEKTYALEALQSTGEIVVVRFSEQTLRETGLLGPYQQYRTAATLSQKWQ